METLPAIVPSRKEMPAEVFVKIWKGEMEVEGTEWEEVVQLDSNSPGFIIVKFNNIEIKDDILIEKGDSVLENLRLTNCKLSQFKIRQSKTNSIALYEKSEISQFVIRGSTTKRIVIQDSRIINDFIVSDGSETENIQISSSNVGRLSFINSIIQDISIIYESAILHGIFIEEMSKTRNIDIENSKIGDFYIRSGSTNGNLILQNGSVAGGFYIKKSKIGNFSVINSVTGRFRIEDSMLFNFSILANSTIDSFELVNSTAANFVIRRNSITRSFQFKNSTISIFSLERSKATVLSIENSRVLKVRIWYSEIYRVQIKSESFLGFLQCNFNLQIPVHIIFAQSSFGHIDFDCSVFPEFTTMSMSNCSANRVSISDFCNYGTVFFSGLKPLTKWKDFKKDENHDPIFVDGSLQFETVIRSSTFCLTDSDLGKMQFINCDLREFQRFEFSNTKMLDVFVAGSQMPDDNAFCLPDDEKNPLKIAEQKRLAYGQFKKIYENRGDVAGSLPYLAYEMEAYRKQLQLEGGWKNRGELAMLWANKLSTNYGVSWQKGLLGTTVVTIFFYSIFCYLIGYRFENNSPDDMERFWKLVSYAPYYLNPLRDLDSVSLVKEENFTPSARIWDFISRIFVAYLVYQTIQAFRKLGKSSG